jgi:cyclopropane-fatty-acyl-phospholipid synthase
MKGTIIPPAATAFQRTGPKPLRNWARNQFLGLFQGIKRGQLVVVDGDENWSFGEDDSDSPLEATVRVLDPRFYLRVLLGGSIGAGEAYMAGYWSADDLTKVVRIIILNHEVFAGVDQGWANLTAILHRVFHFLRKNTEEGSKINIAAHYDLGNDFYALFLDKTLTYSCGIFETPETTLEGASIAKYDRICRKLQLSPGDHVLEIGTGWGGFAIHAAQQYGCRITTTTISRAQLDLAKERVKQAGLEDRVEILLKDYRALEGRYDKLVSIEMIEAVGHHYLGEFFRCCGGRLKDDGMMLLQAITIADHVFEEHKRSVDFIKRYIFPGTCIPSIASICAAVADKSDLRLFHLEDITPHYATTLRFWRHRFLAKVDEVKRLGYSDTFVRMWEFYLCYCEAGFAERYLGDVQMLLTKPRSRRAPLLPVLNT